MSRITPIQYDQADALIKELVNDQISRNGRITNMKSTLLHSVPAFHALMEWYPLRDEMRSFATEREVNLYCHAISTENDCLICSTFFRKILIDSGDDPDHPALTEREQILVRFGRLCVKNPSGIDDGLFDNLRGYFTDPQLVVLTAFAGLMIATNLINTVLHVDLDEYLTSYTRR